MAVGEAESALRLDFTRSPLALSCPRNALQQPTPFHFGYLPKLSFNESRIVDVVDVSIEESWH